MKHRSANNLSVCIVSCILASVSLAGCNSNSSPESVSTPPSAAAANLNAGASGLPAILSKPEQEETFNVSINTSKAVSTLTSHKDNSITGTITYLFQETYTEHEIQGKRGADGKITLTQLNKDGEKGNSWVLSQKENCLVGEGKDYNNETTYISICQ